MLDTFASALDKVSSGDRQGHEPYARQLRDKYEASERGHEIAITDKKHALTTCKNSIP